MRDLSRKLAAWFRPSDDELIERCRRKVAQLDRWGRWLAAFYIAIFVFSAAALIVFIAILSAIANRPDNIFAMPGWAPGFILGMMLGWVCTHLTLGMAHFLGSAITDGRRERLMLRYHDALRDLAALAVERRDA